MIVQAFVSEPFKDGEAGGQWANEIVVGNKKDRVHACDKDTAERNGTVILAMMKSLVAQLKARK